MPIEKVNTQLVGLPPAWMSRVVGQSGAIGNSDEIRKILGEPIPQPLDPKTLPPDIAKFFAPQGMLERFRRKLSLISRKKGGAIIPAKNIIACVDEDDNLYIGTDFLAEYGDNEHLLMGILAHEWGHMMSDLPRNVDWSHLTWDELFALRRDEEADADAFAGRVLFSLGYDPQQLTSFLKALDTSKKKKKLPTFKYHNTATRVEIIKQSFEANKRAMEVARRLFFGSKETGPKIGQIIGSG